MTFSWAQAKERAVETAIRHEITLAKSKNIDFMDKHNDEVLDVAKKNYVKITLRVKTAILKKQAKAMERRSKLGETK